MSTEQPKFEEENFEVQESLAREKGIDQDIINNAMKKWEEEMTIAGVSKKEMEPYRGKGLKEILSGLKENAPDLKTFAILNRKEELNSEDPEMAKLTEKLARGNWTLESNVGWCMEDHAATRARHMFRNWNRFQLEQSYLYVNRDEGISRLDINPEHVIPYKEFSEKRKQLLQRQESMDRDDFDREFSELQGEFKKRVETDMEKLGFHGFEKMGKDSDSHTFEGAIQWAVNDKHYRLFKEAEEKKDTERLAELEERQKEAKGFIF